MSVKILFTSVTGNTKAAVDLLTEDLEDLGVDTEVFDSEDGIEIDDFFDGADAYTIASWSDGDNGEVPGGIVDFYDDLENYDLTGKKVAVLGTGDTSYKNYGAAVDLFSDRVRGDHAAIIGTPLKIELYPDDAAEESLKTLAKDIAQSVQ